MATYKHIRLHTDHQDPSGSWIKSWSEILDAGVSQVFHTLSSQRWGSICRRVKNTAAASAYIDCHNEFTSFQDFVSWSRLEAGYDLEEASGRLWAIDKDIIGTGKIYSPETCIFVPQRVNNFTTMRSAARGDTPIGVHMVKEDDRVYYYGYVGSGSRGIKRHHEKCLDQSEAHRYWQANKVHQGRELALEFKDWHDKLYNGLNNWLDKIEDDYQNCRETIF